jgi:cell division protein FtsI (penicillin-binding protein 3)
MVKQWLQARDEAAERGFESRWRNVVKHRIGVTFVLFAVWAAGVEARLVYLQVIAHAKYAERALDQQQKTIEPPAPRGDILDRHGNLLAYTVGGSSLIAFPTQVDDPAATAKAICQALTDCTAADRKALAEKLSSGRYKPLRPAQALSPEQAGRVMQLKLPGIQLSPEPVRYYPKVELASHVLGWVNRDNLGQGGIEHAYQKDISGRQGRLLVQVDARKNWMQTKVAQPSTPGATLELSIDLNLQHIAERELAKGVQQHRAQGGTAIIMDPFSGEVLALANYPTFNPNAFNKYTEEERRNRAVQDVYEPGSTFKIVTASAAIEEGVIGASELIDCNPGVFVIPGRDPITEAGGHNYGLISFEDVIVRSSNVGAVKAGLRIGADRMVRYTQRFGFGTKLGSDFPGQSAGIVWSRPSINDSALASMAMGYQVSVTPLQMAAAVSAVANGGLLLEPHLVRAIVRDGRREPVAPKVIQRAITAQTAATLTTFMEGVVSDKEGTGSAAKLDRYQVAGKTGTSHKAIPGGYSKTDFNASFVGFVPSRRPALTILVLIDTPRDGQHFGGEVAAPIFRRIAEAALVQSGVAPTIRPVPPVIVATDVAEPGPKPARATSLPVVVPLGGRALMPDVRGMSARDAVRTLGAVGLAPRLDGDGFVVSQTPAPGSAVEPGGMSQLQLHRSPAADARRGGSVKR